VITVKLSGFFWSFSEKLLMNLHNMHILSAMLMLSICSAAAGQNKPPESNEEWPVVHSPGCRISKFPLPGLSTFVDKVDGFQFKYPSALRLDAPSLLFVNTPCVEFFGRYENIQLVISLPDAFESPIPDYNKDAFVGKIVFNQLEWVNVVDQGLERATYCTYWKHEQVCIRGNSDSSPRRLSYNLMRTMHEIESTLVFTDAANRLDAKIAAVKVGDRFGKLRVRRVVTMEMEDRDPRRSYSGSYGEIHFDGYLRLVGSMENTGTRLSSRWEFSQDDEGSSQTRVELRLPFDPGRDPLDHIEFNNAYPIGERLAKFPPSPDGPAVEQRVSIILRNIVAIFYPVNNIGPFVRADLVSMVPAH
jgi:hypothetical protein